MASGTENSLCRLKIIKSRCKISQHWLEKSVEFYFLSGQGVELEFGFVNSGRVVRIHRGKKVLFATVGGFKLQLAAEADAQLSGRAKSRYVCLGQGNDFQVTADDKSCPSVIKPLEFVVCMSSRRE
jgi:hypothetical protein